MGPTALGVDWRRPLAGSWLAFISACEGADQAQEEAVAGRRGSRGRGQLLAILACALGRCGMPKRQDRAVRAADDVLHRTPKEASLRCVGVTRSHHDQVRCLDRSHPEDLGLGVADVSGRSFQAFVHDEVLRPLAMRNTWAGATPESARAIAPRYSSLLRTFKSAPREPTLPGASVLYTSAHELALFGLFHLKARHSSQRAVLSDAGIASLQEPSVPAGSRRQSLAWSINDQHGYRTLVAQGGTYDSQALLLLVPSEKIAVVALANAGNVVFTEAIDRILSLLLPAYRESLARVTPSAVAPPRARPPAARRLSQAAGPERSTPTAGSFPWLLRSRPRPRSRMPFPGTRGRGFRSGWS
jgi:hypothetical protein